LVAASGVSFGFLDVGLDHLSSGTKILAPSDSDSKIEGLEPNRMKEFSFSSVVPF
jgi:hypothetical protein